MIQTVEHLALPWNTYHALEQIARLQGTTPAHIIDSWIQQHQQAARLHTLRQEYQELIDKDLSHVLTADEGNRLAAICEELNAIEMASEANRNWQKKADEIDAQFEERKRVLAALPDRRRE